MTHLTFSVYKFPTQQQRKHTLNKLYATILRMLNDDIYFLESNYIKINKIIRQLQILKHSNMNTIKNNWLCDIETNNYELELTSGKDWDTEKESYQRCVDFVYGLKLYYQLGFHKSVLR